MPTDPNPPDKSHTIANGPTAMWTTNSNSPEVKIPKGQFLPGDFTQPKKKTGGHTDPTAPGSPLV